jgi:hypothetical protein
MTHRMKGDCVTRLYTQAVGIIYAYIIVSTCPFRALRFGVPEFVLNLPFEIRPSSSERVIAEPENIEFT